MHVFPVHLLPSHATHLRISRSHPLPFVSSGVVLRRWTGNDNANGGIVNGNGDDDGPLRRNRNRPQSEWMLAILENLFQVNIADPVAGTFKIVHTTCNFPLTYSGSTTGADPLRAGLVIVKGSPTIFRVVPADPTIPSGPFNIIETTSGLALTKWRFNPGTVMYSPVTLEFLIRGDARQSFSFVTG
ncbi:hypothetical protein C8J57DRAFT_1706500 [Mycena rebaudengoi]|nr:hypothetical protein C8J57DRAFT_1706500 [Mycena rebaudengoi]